MTKHNVANLIIEHMKAVGMDSLYCLPGVQNDDFFNALYDHTDEIDVIMTRHEQGAAYMALGAAIATGKPQAYCVVPGEGMLNATAAHATAFGLAACHHGATGAGPMVASRFAIHLGRPAEFTGHQDRRRVEQSVAAQSIQQRGHGLVETRQQLAAELVEIVLMRVPAFQ